MLLLKFANLTEMKLGMLIQTAKSKGLECKLMEVCDSKRDLVIFCSDYMELWVIREHMCKLLEPKPLFNDLANLDLHLDFNTFYVIDAALSALFIQYARDIESCPKPLIFQKSFECDKIVIHLAATEKIILDLAGRIINDLKEHSLKTEQNLKECLEYFRTARPVTLAFIKTGIGFIFDTAGMQKANKLVEAILAQDKTPAGQDLSRLKAQTSNLTWMTEPKIIQLEDPDVLKKYLLFLIERYKLLGQSIDQARKTLEQTQIVFEVVA